MFERYTERARRVVFFARYEASQYGSPEIEPEHLLLGVIREMKYLRRWVPNTAADSIREAADARMPKRASIPTSVDLPLSDDSKTALKVAQEEADRLAHRYIGTEHLLLGILAVPQCLATELLTKGGADAQCIRGELSRSPMEKTSSLVDAATATPPSPTASFDSVEIHGKQLKLEDIRAAVSLVRSNIFHWEKMRWKPRDIVIRHTNGAISFDLTLAEDKTSFTLVKQGWKKDHCCICRWELSDCEGEHGIGYTNGRDWLCLECCERFVRGNFFSSSYSDIT